MADEPKDLERKLDDLLQQAVPGYQPPEGDSERAEAPDLAARSEGEVPLPAADEDEEPTGEAGGGDEELADSIEQLIRDASPKPTADATYRHLEPELGQGASRGAEDRPSAVGADRGDEAQGAVESEVEGASGSGEERLAAEAEAEATTQPDPAMEAVDEALADIAEDYLHGSFETVEEVDRLESELRASAEAEAPDREGESEAAEASHQPVSEDLHRQSLDDALDEMIASTMEAMTEAPGGGEGAPSEETSDAADLPSEEAHAEAAMGASREVGGPETEGAPTEPASREAERPEADGGPVERASEEAAATEGARAAPAADTTHTATAEDVAAELDADAGAASGSGEGPGGRGEEERASEQAAAEVSGEPEPRAVAAGYQHDPLEDFEPAPELEEELGGRPFAAARAEGEPGPGEAEGGGELEGVGEPEGALSPRRSFLDWFADMCALVNRPAMRWPVWQRNLIGLIGVETAAVALWWIAYTVAGGLAAMVAAVLLGAGWFVLFYRLFLARREGDQDDRSDPGASPRRAPAT